MQDNKNKVETILFTTGRFLSIEEISKLTGLEINGIKGVLEGLKKNYNENNGALEITEQGEKWKLSIRKAYLYLTESLLTDAELDKPTQETLAVIAYKNPAKQFEIINIRGNKAYDHIHMLKELGFITSEPLGRSRLIKLTQKFFDYFDVVEDQLKSKLKDVENKGQKEAVNKNLEGLENKESAETQNAQEN